MINKSPLPLLLTTCIIGTVMLNRINTSPVYTTEKNPSIPVETTGIVTDTPKVKISAVPNNPMDILFEKVEITPAFPGGNEAWRKFLVANLNPNTPVDNGAPFGSYMIILRFIVDKEGNLSDFKALTTYGYGLEEEALRVMKKSPRWVAGIQNGQKVNCYHEQKFAFVVENGDGDEGRKKKRKRNN